MDVGALLESIGVSTRRDRRKAVSVAISLLHKVRQAEVERIVRTPENLRGGKSFGYAEASVYIIDDALGNLYDAY